MKINRIFAIAAGLLALASCSDFEEINKNPKAASAAEIKPYWALDKAIVSDQQNPNDAERIFVIYWTALAHINGDDGYGVTGGESYDDYANCLYSLSRNCITSANTAITIADEAISSGTLGEREAALFANVKAFSRIWRVYLMTEFVDSFGSFTTDFESTSPKYQSVEECYDFMLAELGEAVRSIDASVQPSSDGEKNSDPAYQLDPAKWKNFGISMWMRLAMRISEAAPAKAKAEFEKAVAAGEGIRTIPGTFRVAEKNGWWDISGVMSRTWNRLLLSNTMANLMTNLGGAKTEDILLDKGGRFYKTAPDAAAIADTYGPYIKDAHDYLGIHMVNKDGNNIYESNTDSPTWGYFFDGIPSRIDPRAFAYYSLPGDYDRRIETGYCTSPRVETPITPYLDKKNEALPIDVSYSWNGMVSGWAFDDVFWNETGIGTCPKTPKEGVSYTRWHTFPPLAERYRNNNEFRVFFGPWETYFLLAEAAVRGWNAGIGAEAAYNAGIKISFEYLSVGANYDAYINSEDYNRVGTSVKFTHTAEPADYTIRYTDPVSGSEKTMVYNYPDADKILYKGKKLNDQITKIITQKYIANAPWLPVESWCDQRRLGLPFFEIPVSSTELNYLDGWTKTAYQNGQKPGYYPQRMKYPSSLQNANPQEYQNALSLMGMTDENITTPLWWAIQK